MRQRRDWSDPKTVIATLDAVNRTRSLHDDETDLLEKAIHAEKAGRAIYGLRRLALQRGFIHLMPENKTS